MEAWEETVTLYRAVSPSEYRQLRTSGHFQQLGGAEGKYFAEQAAHARVWGRALFGKEQFIRKRTVYSEKNSFASCA